MARVKANGIEIEYDERGPKDGSVILLIMGLGMQLIAWPDSFCDALAARGFRVIRFDNRDVGLSTKMRSGGPLILTAAMARALVGLPVKPPYTLHDMAADVIGLMDALGIESAHVVGASLGGMIAQIVAAEHPERVLSLVSLMSTSGNSKLPRPSREIMRALITPRPRSDRKRAIERMTKLLSMIGSPGYKTSETELRAKVERAITRSYYPIGITRQLLAVQTGGSRVKLLKTIKAPTLVLHGAEDPLISLEAGRDTAAHIPGAQLRIFPGMGHDLPAELLPALAHDIAEHCKDAENATLASAPRARGGMG